MEQQHRPIFVTRSSLPPFEEYLAEIRDIWESRWLTNMGEKHRALEQALAEKLETPHVTLFANGHLALEELQDYTLWLAEYGDTPGFRYHFDCLQYTDSGTVAGIEGSVDLDLWIEQE